MRECEISFCNERRTEVVSCFRQGEVTRRGLHAMMGEGLALILSHSYFLIHGWENRFPSDEEDAFGGKTTNELLDVFLQ